MMTPSSLDKTMMALADPTRRAILERLSPGEARVTEIAQPFDMSLNAVSKHVLILERAHLVHRRRQGLEHFRSVNAEPLAEAAGWIDDYRGRTARKGGERIQGGQRTGTKHSPP